MCVSLVCECMSTNKKSNHNMCISVEVWVSWYMMLNVETSHAYVSKRVATTA